MLQLVDYQWLQRIVESGDNQTEGFVRLYQTIKDGLKEEKFTADNFSYKQLAYVCGALDPFREEKSAMRMSAESVDLSKTPLELIFRESNPGLMTNAFQVVTQELISSKVIEGYESDEGWIADMLVETVPARMRNQKLAGFTALNGPDEVAEGHPYPETGFSEKWVSTQETKKGRILRVSEELLLFDQTGEINRLAKALGYWCRQERERTIVRGVIDADSDNGKFIYRPSGVGEALYGASNKNYVGSGGVSGYDAAVPLTDWTSLETPILYRATQVKDDRVDGTPRNIPGLNGPGNILLVPQTLMLKGEYIVNSTGGEERSNTGARVTQRRNPVSKFIKDVVSSDILDEVSPADWYYGNPKRQFVWTEIWPVQTFSQGSTSEAAFERDTIMAVKVRYYGGLSATDTVYVTKVDGE